MTSTDLKDIIDRSSIHLLEIDDDERDLITEARAVQSCLRHLLRDAASLGLEMTTCLLAATIEAVEADLGKIRN